MTESQAAVVIDNLSVIRTELAVLIGLVAGFILCVSFEYFRRTWPR